MSTSPESEKPERSAFSLVMDFIGTTSTSPELAESIGTPASVTQFFKDNFQGIESVSIKGWRTLTRYAYARTTYGLRELHRVQDQLQVIPEVYGTPIDLGTLVSKEERIFQPEFDAWAETAGEEDCMVWIIDLVRRRREAQKELERLTPEFEARTKKAHTPTPLK